MSYTFNTGNSFATLGRLEESVLVSNHSLIIPTDKKWPQFPINHSVIIYTNVLYVYNYYFRKSFKKLSVSINHYLKASKKSKLFLIPVALQTVLLSVLPFVLIIFTIYIYIYIYTYIYYIYILHIYIYQYIIKYIYVYYNIYYIFYIYISYISC